MVIIYNDNTYYTLYQTNNWFITTHLQVWFLVVTWYNNMYKCLSYILGKDVMDTEILELWDHDN